MRPNSTYFLFDFFRSTGSRHSRTSMSSRTDAAVVTATERPGVEACACSPDACRLLDAMGEEPVVARNWL